MSDETKETGGVGAPSGLENSQLDVRLSGSIHLIKSSMSEEAFSDHVSRCLLGTMVFMVGLLLGLSWANGAFDRPMLICEPARTVWEVQR